MRFRAGPDLQCCNCLTQAYTRSNPRFLRIGQKKVEESAFCGLQKADAEARRDRPAESRFCSTAPTGYRPKPILFPSAVGRRPWGEVLQKTARRKRKGRKRPPGAAPR